MPAGRAGAWLQPQLRASLLLRHLAAAAVAAGMTYFILLRVALELRRGIDKLFVDLGGKPVHSFHAIARNDPALALHLDDVAGCFQLLERFAHDCAASVPVVGKVVANLLPATVSDFKVRNTKRTIKLNLSQE